MLRPIERLDEGIMMIRFQLNGGVPMAPKTSRRDFLSAGLMVPVASASSKMGLWSPSATAVAETPDSPVKLDYKVLGRTGLKVTTVGFGCMITSDGSVIERAADAGINYFDTARGYSHGNNERMVGAALGAKRKQVVLSTKTHAPDKAGMEQHLEQSLRELNTDYIDIWYLHGRSSGAEIDDEMIEVQQAAKKAGQDPLCRREHAQRPERSDSLDGGKGRVRRGAGGLQLYNERRRGPGMDQAIDEGGQGGPGRGGDEGDGRWNSERKARRPHVSEAGPAGRLAGGAEVGGEQARCGDHDSQHDG